MKLLNTMMLILLFISSINICQIRPLDSNNVALDISTLKIVINSLIERESLINKNQLQAEEIRTLQQMNDEYRWLYDASNDRCDMYKEQIKVITPAWYDRFTYGFISAILSALAVVIIAK